MIFPQNDFKILGLEPGCSKQLVIQAIYKKLAKDPSKMTDLRRLQDRLLDDKNRFAIKFFGYLDALDLTTETTPSNSVVPVIKHLPNWKK